MINFAKHRARFEDAKSRSRQVAMANAIAAQPNCEHDWKDFRQDVRPDNPEWICLAAYFIVRGCLKCHAKRYIGYVVE